MFDIIGDIHGYIVTLERLLQKMGYRKTGGVYRHPDRKAVFVGDFTDRGPGVRAVLKLVKKMVDAGTAYAVMGNHEFNFISYNTYYNGMPLREHSLKTSRQIKETEESFKGKTESKKKLLQWTQSLPLYLEFDNFRVIHACWDFEYIERLSELLPDQKLTSEFLIKANRVGTEEYRIIEILLKGKELILPRGASYTDKDGNNRRRIRYQWWRKVDAETTYRRIAVNYEPEIPNTLVPLAEFHRHVPYLHEHKPVFVGHYWQRGTPRVLSANVCCVDYGVGKCHLLVAYRFDGEQVLSNDKFIYVSCTE